MAKRITEHLWSTKANTIITLAATVGGLAFLYHFVKAPIDQIAAKSVLLNQVAIDVDDIKTKGSRPLQEIVTKVTAVIKDVEELKAKGAEPMRERMTKVEAVIETIKPALDRIDRKLERVETRLLGDRYGSNFTQDPNDDAR